MSYVRFHWGDSDLYVYESEQGIECCGCRLEDDRTGPIGWTYTDPADFIRHLGEHRLMGHVVRPGLEWDIWDDWRTGEFGPMVDDFDPDFPEPVNATAQERVEWNREVLRDLGWLLPVIGKPQMNRDGTPNLLFTAQEKS